MPLAVTAENLIEIAKNSCQNQGFNWPSDLENLLLLCFAEPALFPKKGKLDINFLTEKAEIESYLTKYTQKFFMERESTIQFKNVATLPDPAVDEVLHSFANVPSNDLDKMKEYHRLSMAAENLIGSLLERYIASRLGKSGWIWACGETLRAVDFFKPGSPPSLLQVKNRSNSENSSSSAIRIGTNIQKWYRINAANGQTNWEDLQTKTGVILSEDDFYAFIRLTAKG
jgi:hypothetical protein